MYLLHKVTCYVNVLGMIKKKNIYIYDIEIKLIWYMIWKKKKKKSDFIEFMQINDKK